MSKLLKTQVLVNKHGITFILMQYGTIKNQFKTQFPTPMYGGGYDFDKYFDTRKEALEDAHYKCSCEDRG